MTLQLGATVLIIFSALTMIGWGRISSNIWYHVKQDYSQRGGKVLGRRLSPFKWVRERPCKRGQATRHHPNREGPSYGAEAPRFLPWRSRRGTSSLACSPVSLEMQWHVNRRSFPCWAMICIHNYWNSELHSHHRHSWNGQNSLWRRRWSSICSLSSLKICRGPRGRFHEQRIHGVPIERPYLYFMEVCEYTSMSRVHGFHWWKEQESETEGLPPMDMLHSPPYPSKIEPHKRKFYSLLFIKAWAKRVIVMRVCLYRGR